MAHRFTAKVTRIYPTVDATYVRLAIPTAEAPKDDYFKLSQTHSNYNALYSLALSAAINGYDLSIRTRGEVDKNDYGEVAYMVVSW